MYSFNKHLCKIPGVDFYLLSYLLRDTATAPVTTVDLLPGKCYAVIYNSLIEECVEQEEPGYRQKQSVPTVPTRRLRQRQPFGAVGAVFGIWYNFRCSWHSRRSRRSRRSSTSCTSCTSYWYKN